MQTIKTYIKTYIKKVKLLNPITLFKNNLILFEKLEHRVRNLERVNDFGDIERRLEDLEYYDLYNIEEKAENAERKAEENDNYIESIKERSETNQESIKILKDKFNVLKHNIESDKENLFDIEADIKTIKKVDFAGIAERVSKIESEKENIFTAGALDAINALEDRVDNLQELAKKYLNAELEAVALKQEKTEENLSAMQKLSFEICRYYGGDFNLDDFNNCYDIIKKYNINLNAEGGKSVK